MRTPKYYHGLPCNCFTRLQILGIVPVDSNNCPSMCNAPSGGIIDTSNNFTVDGWYLQVDASNLVYMESNVITQAVPCPSGLANYGHEGGNEFGGYEYPHFYNTDLSEWKPLMEVRVRINSGTEYYAEVYVPQGFVDITSLGNFQTSIDNGATWQNTLPFNVNSGLSDEPFDIGTLDFIYRVVMTDAITGCQYYNPNESGQSVIYFILDDPFLSQFTGWTFNGTDLLDFRDNILPTMPHFLYDASADEAGDSIYVAFSGSSIPDITVIDALSNPVVLDWQVLNNEVPCISATFTVVDPSDTIIEYLLINNYIITASALAVTNPLCATEIQNVMVGNGFGSSTTVEINVAGNDVTIIFRNSNGLINGVRWLDSAMNTGDETLIPCI